VKVLFIVTSFPRAEDDIITPWMVENIQRLREKGVEVTVYTCSSRGLGDQVVHGVQVRRFRYCLRRWELLSHDETIPEQIRKNKLFILLVLPYILFGVLGLRRVLRLDRFDLIHVHWPFPLGVFGWFARRWSGLPLVTQFYGVELRWVRAKMKLFIPFLRSVIRGSDMVSAISSHTAAEIEAVCPGTHVELIPYGSPVPPPRECPPPEGGPGRVRRVLFVGRLVERKGVEFLVRALKELASPFPVRLDIVGSGPESGALAALVEELGLKDRVFLAGRVSNEDLLGYYAACDCFVLPAIVDHKGDTEGLGVVLIEALCYRKPVVASALGGIVDIIKDEHTGLLVPEKDPKALAAALHRVLTDEALAARLGADGYAFAQEYFDPGRIAGRWAQLYSQLAGPGSKR